MMVASWFAVVKAGGIAVAAMPLLRAKELGTIIEIAQISHALCDAALLAEVQAAQAANPRLQAVRYFNGAGLPAAQALEPLMAQASPHFDTVQTAATDTCLLGFTSGTTGVPKATMHFHRDVMAICACWPRHVLRAEPNDVFIGSPPLAFTFGLGGQVLFPMAIGASMALLEKAGPVQLVDGIEQFGATVVFTAPTSYRVMAQQGERLRQTRLRKCVSAGEALNASTRALWKAATGIEIIDGVWEIGQPRTLEDIQGRFNVSRTVARALARPRCCTSSSPTARTRPGLAPPAAPCPATVPRWSMSRARKCRPARWASWPCRAPPAAAT